MKVLTRFVTSAAEARRFPPPSVPEIAFAGRSNVGKSSLINSLAGSKIAKTSSTPGRTRTINFFEIRLPGRPHPELIFADLPGYGYAKLSREISAEWPKFIEPYLRERETMALCVALVDANVPPQASDVQLVTWLRKHHRPYLLVATKADKLSGNQRTNALARLCEAFEVERVLPFSAKDGMGKRELWQAIRGATASFPDASSEPLNHGGHGAE